MRFEELKRLSETNLSNLARNEQTVKYNIVLPFLKAFDYDSLDLEHAAQGSRVDINIGNKIIVETKSLDKNLDNYLSQLKDYCDTERPFLAVLTNGRTFRFYSPLMRVSNFADTLIYEFKIEDFAIKEVVERIDKILGLENFKNQTFLTYIEEREGELSQVKAFIKDFDLKKYEDIRNIEEDIQQIRSEIEKCETEIKLKQQEIDQIKSKQIPEKEGLYKKHFIPIVSSSLPLQTPQSTTITQTPIVIPSTTADTSIIYKIDSPREGVKASGKYYDNKRFIVLKGSTVSISLDDSFPIGAAGAYALRNDLQKRGIINLSREFTEDYTFNSLSQAASVVLGGSRSGPREWKQ